jgi:hypothetical protein
VESRHPGAKYPRRELPSIAVRSDLPSTGKETEGPAGPTGTRGARLGTMPDETDLALSLARALCHELTNHLQPLAWAIEHAEVSAARERASYLAIAREAVAGCLALATELRAASVPASADRSFALSQAVAEAIERAGPAIRDRVQFSLPTEPVVIGDRAMAVLALSHLLREAADNSPRNAIEVGVGPPGQASLVVRFGPTSPSRDDPAPELGLEGPVRLNPQMALAWLLSTRGFGTGSLRARPGVGSGRYEVWARHS